MGVLKASGLEEVGMGCLNFNIFHDVRSLLISFEVRLTIFIWL